MNEKNERASALLASFDYFFCDIMNARMSKKSCLIRQRDKNCSFANRCNMGVSIHEQNTELRQEVFNAPDRPKEPHFGNNYKGFRNKPKTVATERGEEMKPGPKPKPKSKQQCNYEGCEELVMARSLCKDHYDGWRTGRYPELGPFTRKQNRIAFIEEKGAEMKAEKEKEAKMPEPQEDTGSDKNPTLLYLDFSQYKDLMELLRKEAHKNVRTMEQQAIFYIKQCVDIDPEVAAADILNEKEKIL